MKFPFVTRKKYDRIVKHHRKLVEMYATLEIKFEQLEKDYDTLLNNAITQRHKFEDWQTLERAGFETERGHFEAILTNIKKGEK